MVNENATMYELDGCAVDKKIEYVHEDKIRVDKMKENRFRYSSMYFTMKETKLLRLVKQ